MLLRHLLNRILLVDGMHREAVLPVFPILGRLPVRLANLFRHSFQLAKELDVLVKEMGLHLLPALVVLLGLVLDVDRLQVPLHFLLIVV